MIVNASALADLFAEFKGLYDASLQSAVVPFDVAPFTMFVPTKTITVNYDWLGDLPAMRRWIGPRHAKGIKASTYSVSNVPYETTLEVFVRDLEADNIGIYRPKIAALAQETKRHPLRLFAAVIADNAVCADGQNLIDTDHPKDDGSTWSNKGTSALSLSTLKTARLAMRKFTDSNGDPIGCNPNILMVPPDLEDTAVELVYSPSKPGTANNDVNVIRKWGLDVLVNPFLTDTNNWYLFDTALPAKPIIHQQRKAPVYEQDETERFMKGIVYHGIDGDYAMAPGFPQGLYGAIVAGG